MARRFNIPAAALLALLAGVASAGNRQLTLSEAMELAVRNNITVRVASAQGAAARARVMESAAALLPRIIASAGETRTYRENLDAMGFTGFGFLGPFNTFNARLTLVHDVFNWNSYQKFRSQREKEQSALLRENLAREQVCAAAALAYIEVLRADAATESARADEKLSSELLNLAQERHSAGTATGLDIAREKTRVAQEHSRVLYAQTAGDDARLRLKHLAGIRLTDDVALSDTLALSATSFQESGAATAQALRERLELAIGRAELQSAVFAVSAARARRMPVVSLEGNFGISGNEPDRKSGSVGDFGVLLKLPLFTGGEIRGAVAGAKAAETEVYARLEDMEVQVQEDVLLALKRLAASVEQVETAELALNLAQSELGMAQGRFAAGIGDNVELVNAQTALSLARSSRVAALAQYNNSKINFALAQGRMRAFSLH